MPTLNKPDRDESESNQAGVQSVETGIDLLIALARLTSNGPSQMLKAIAHAAGIPAAKAHRYLVSFKRTGMVEQDPVSGHYRLGPSARLVGAAAMRSADLIPAATKRLPELTGTTGYSTALAIWTQSGPTIVWVEDAPGPVRVTTQVGTILPLLTSATGRAFAAWLPPSLTDATLTAELAAFKRPAAERKKALQVFKEAHKNGVAGTVGELNGAISALAAPVFDHEEQVAGVIAILGASGIFDARPDGPLARKMRAAAAELSEQLGHLGNR